MLLLTSNKNNEYTYLYYFDGSPVLMGRLPMTTCSHDICKGAAHVRRLLLTPLVRPAPVARPSRPCRRGHSSTVCHGQKTSAKNGVRWAIRSRLNWMCDLAVSRPIAARIGQRSCGAVNGTLQCARQQAQNGNDTGTFPDGRLCAGREEC